jgi:AAA domain
VTVEQAVRDEPAFLRRLKVREHSVGWLTPCPDIHGSSGFSVVIRPDEATGRYRFQCVDAEDGDPCSNERQLVKLLGLEETELSLNAWRGEFKVVTVEAFSEVEEDGAQALLGTDDDAVIAAGSDFMVYGDGGAGKTTLMVDLACHLAAGDDWLGMHVERPLCVLLLENEGPRQRFRAKLRRKLAEWTGSPIEGRVLVVEEPWKGFTLQEPAWRDRLAMAIKTRDVDIVIAGPLTAIGMEEAGTLQQTRAFLGLVDLVRKDSGRPVTFGVVHHEGKSGKVSGAWEAVGDTLLHIQKRGHGRTALYMQKLRWAPDYHAKTLELVWAAGERFTVEVREEKDDETARGEILDYVREHPGTGWKKVEDAVEGIAREKRRELRDVLLATGELVNLTKDGEPLSTLEDRKAARLYVADDPTIRHLGRDSGPVAAQTEELAF